MLLLGMIATLATDKRNTKKKKINRVGDRQLKMIPRQKRPSLELKAVLSNLPTCSAESQ
jgi:hypothetical protein